MVDVVPAEADGQQLRLEEDVRRLLQGMGFVLILVSGYDVWKGDVALGIWMALIGSYLDLCSSNFDEAGE